MSFRRCQRFCVTLSCLRHCNGARRAHQRPSLRSVASQATPSAVEVGSSTNNAAAASPSRANDFEPTVDDLKALLRRVLAIQRPALEEYVAVLARERQLLEEVSANFDAKIAKLESVREEIRTLIHDANVESIRRRDEILEQMIEDKVSNER